MAAPNLFDGKLALIEQIQAPVQPFDRLNLFRSQQTLAHGISLVQLRRYRTIMRPAQQRKSPDRGRTGLCYLDMAGNSK